MTDLELLKQVELLRGVEQDVLVAVSRAGYERRAPAGAFIFHQGDEAGRMYVVLSGRIKLTQVTPDGQQVNLGYATPGQAFGLIAVLATNFYPVSAQAIEDSRVFSLDSQQVRAQIEGDARLAVNAMQIMAARIRVFQDIIRQLSTQRVERRIAAALVRLAGQAGKTTARGILIDLPLSRQDLGELTGTTLYTVSRTLRDWEEKGLVKSEREQVTVTDLESLRAIAEDLPGGKI